MCGLVGVAGVIVTKDVDVFNELLYHDYVRGKDSTGVASAHEHTGEINVFKGCFDPVGLSSMKGYDRVVNTTTKVLMGHNRHATRGNRANRHNAHPFATDNILGAHNGTLDYSCLKDLSANVAGETDSEQLILSIHDLGGRIPDAIALCSGAWALSVYNKEENTINLVRNDKRPLFYCMAESKKTLYWASEAGLLAWVLDRNGIKRGKVYELTKDSVKTWVIPKMSEVFGEPGREKAEGKEPVNFQSGGTHQYGRHYGAGTPWEHYNRQTEMGWDEDSRSSAGSNSGSNGNSNSVLKPDATDYDKWVPYGHGYSAHDVGQLRRTNPYRRDSKSFEDWNEGWDDSHKYGAQIDAIEARQTKKTEPVVDPVQPKTAEVVKLDDKRARAYQTRVGPGGKSINRGQFREITKCECSWCNDPVDFEDKGRFHTQPSGDLVYYCESCVSSEKDLNINAK